jgi:hypothetical protein
MTGENPADDGFDGAGRRDVETPATGAEREPGPAPVIGIGRPANEPFLLQAVEDAGQRARVNAEDPGESARRDAGSTPEDAQGDALRAREPEGGVHALGHGLQPVVERPDEAHEVEHLAEMPRRPV